MADESATRHVEREPLIRYATAADGTSIAYWTVGKGSPLVYLVDNGWVIREFAKAAPYPFGTSGDAAVYKLSGGNTDLTVFMDAGWAGLNIAYAEGITHYHTRLDTVGELDERSLQHLGSYVLALTRHFGDADLDHTKAPEEVYFNLLGSVIHYPQRWAIPLTAFVALLFAGVVALGLRRKQLLPGGIALGSLALLVSVIVTALDAYATHLCRG